MPWTTMGWVDMGEDPEDFHTASTPEQPLFPLEDLYGGLLPAEVTVIARDPNTGKTVEITGLRGMATVEVEYESARRDREGNWEFLRYLTNNPVKWTLSVDKLKADSEGRYLMMKFTDDPEESEAPPWEHPGHKPTQHRDRRPPWCNECGWSSPRPATPAMNMKDMPTVGEGQR